MRRGRARLTLRRLAGVALGFLGVAVLIGPESLAISTDQLAEIAVLLAAVSYAAAGIWGRRLRELPIEVAARRHARRQRAASAASGAAARASLAHLADAGEPRRAGGAGRLSTAVAYLLYFRLLRRVGPTNLLLVTFLLPIVALALGAVFLGEHIEIGDLAGLALILAGLAAIDGRFVGLFRATSPAAAGTSGSPPDSRRS
jgi:drug/metabolite transporter (DMT)-like permease